MCSREYISSAKQQVRFSDSKGGKTREAAIRPNRKLDRKASQTALPGTWRLKIFLQQSGGLMSDNYIDRVLTLGGW